MGLSLGIVGLPNVGKSTLFNALTNLAIDAANFPFCTIEPNKGIVSVPDKRLGVLSGITKSQKILPATIEFIDIAGLVAGASKGEGLGNKFLANIREVSAIVHMVRCFDDDQVVHVDGSVDPCRDIDIINTELLLSDVEQVQKAIDNLKRKIKSNQKDDVARLAILTKCNEAFSEGVSLRNIELSDDEKLLIKEYNFLSGKRVIYCCNVAEVDLEAGGNAHVEAVKKVVANENSEVMVLSANLEQELSTLSDDEKSEYLASYGLDQSGLSVLAVKSYHLLGLQTYLTTGEKETRAWTIPVGATAPQAAGEIHTDFEKGFIRANIIHYDQFVECNGLKIAKEKGLLRQEGKEYIVKDGDVIEFLFNV